MRLLGNLSLIRVSSSPYSIRRRSSIASLGETPSLGGAAPTTAPATTTAAAPAATGTIDGADITAGLIDTDGAELAHAEKADFDRAKSSFDTGDYAAAADQFARFTEVYQGGPLTGLAHLMRGESYERLGKTSSAARAYLDSYSGTPDGPTAPTALLKLGISLDGIGQTQEACITLSEVTVRFPATDASIEAQAARAGMGCS